MVKIATKKCPRCDSIMERIYHREHVADKYPYVPIGYICPRCCENMIVLDRGYRKQDGYDGITCPECHGRSIVLVDGADEKLKCLSCKHIFELTPLPQREPNIPKRFQIKELKPIPRTDNNLG